MLEIKKYFFVFINNLTESPISLFIIIDNIKDRCKNMPSHFKTFCSIHRIWRNEVIDSIDVSVIEYGIHNDIVLITSHNNIYHFFLRLQHFDTRLFM